MTKQAAPCMFCGKLPCECNKKPDPKPKAKAAPRPKPKEEPAPLVPPSTGPMSGKSSPMTGAQYSTGIGASRATPLPEPVETQKDTVMGYAVELLVMSGLVHDKEIPRLKKLFRPVKSPATATKITKWRRRNHGT